MAPGQRQGRRERHGDVVVATIVVVGDVVSTEAVRRQHHVPKRLLAARKAALRCLDAAPFVGYNEGGGARLHRCRATSDGVHIWSGGGIHIATWIQLKNKYLNE